MSFRRLSSLFVIFGAFILLPQAHASELALNLYGLSYHLDRRDEQGHKFNERNPGVGIHFSFLERNRSTYFVEAAVFRDSYRYAAKYMTLGYDYNLHKGLSLGVILGFYDSEAVIGDGFVLVAVPMLSYRYNDFKVHLVHLPEFPGINPYPAFALYFTVYLLHGGSGESARH